MRYASQVLRLVFMVSLVASCGPAPTGVLTATSPIPLSATKNSALPTSTPNVTVTATPLGVDGIFVIPTKNSYPEATPTAIETPASASASLQLRTLSEGDWLNFISLLQERSYQYFPPYGDWWSEGQFIASQEPVALAIQEYLYHYSSEAETDRLHWQLAFIDSLMYEGLKGNEYYDEWIVKQLQNLLNRGVIEPDNLESILDQYWFDVDYFQSVSNLFGDETRSWFYVIKSQVWQEEEDYQKSPDYFDRGGLFVVVHELDQGVFQVYILENAWGFSHGASSLFEISDHNQNGRSEIALSIGYHSGTMCSGNLEIFEWRDSSFVDLTRGDIQIGDCVDNYEYSLINNVPSIILNRFFQPVSAIYTWNGTYYEFSEYQYTNLLEKWSSAGSFSDEAEAIKEILASENLSGLSPAQVDFLRYRLGILYALISRVAEAKQILQALVDKPLDETRTIYSELAVDFLGNYSGDKTLYGSCQRSRESYDQKIRSSSQGEEGLLGITFDFSSGFGPGLLRCFSGDVFEILIGKMPVSIENVAEELRKHGVDLYYTQQQDVNLDGLSDEWVFIIDEGLFVVFPDGQFYRAVRLDYFWLNEDVSKYSLPDLHIENWNEIQNPVLTMSADREVLILNIGENYEPIWLDTEYDVDNIIFVPQDTPAQFQVFHTKPNLEDDYFDPPWEGNRWDASRGKFRDDLLEYTLFVERNPDVAVELAKTIVPRLLEGKDRYSSAWWYPRYYYLCGLSFELSGDVQKAVEIYWQLWRDYPNTPYALMARFKLELVSP